MGTCGTGRAVLRADRPTARATARKGHTRHMHGRGCGLSGLAARCKKELRSCCGLGFGITGFRCTKRPMTNYAAMHFLRVRE